MVFSRVRLLQTRHGKSSPGQLERLWVAEELAGAQRQFARLSMSIIRYGHTELGK